MLQQSNRRTRSDTTDIAVTQQLLGMEAFDSHRAEDEPWLPAVFEAPPEFDLINSTRSCIVFGDPGSGKSAVYAVLIHNSLTATERPHRLLVEWHPQPPKSQEELSSALVDRQLDQVLDACAYSVIAFLARYPQTFTGTQQWVQWVLIWFVRCHLLGDFEVRTGRLAQQASEAGRELVAHLASSPVRAVLDPDTGPELVLAELVKALAEIGLAGVWVLVDRLETWSDIDASRLTAGLTAFLSALGLFEQRGFAYKIFLPTTLTSHLSSVSAIERRRVEVHHLRWTPNKLALLVSKRATLALGQPINSLASLCKDKSLPDWLQKCGDLTPRGWLEYMRPLVAAYLERVRRGQTAPIERAEWLEIRRRHPPLLKLDARSRTVMVGERAILDFPEGQFRLLAYLYANAGRTCSRSELHYRADLGLDHEPRAVGDLYYESPKEYSGKLDTAIWRLRDLIEPDLSEKNKYLFVITEKGKGYRLENAYKPFGS